MKTTTITQQVVRYHDSLFSHKDGCLVIANRHEHHTDTVLPAGRAVDGPKFGPEDKIPDFAFDDISHVDLSHVDY